jgi:hypothetical protein
VRGGCSLNRFGNLIDQSLLGKWILSGSRLGDCGCCNRIFIGHFLFLVENDSLWRFYDIGVVFNELFIAVKIIEKLIHDVFWLLLVYFDGGLFGLGHRFFGFDARVEHELVDGLIIFREFFLLFAACFLNVIIVFPDLATVVLVAETFVINDEVVIISSFLPFVIFFGIDFLKHILRFFNLNRKIEC